MPTCGFTVTSPSPLRLTAPDSIAKKEKGLFTRCKEKEKRERKGFAVDHLIALFLNIQN